MLLFSIDQRPYLGFKGEDGIEVILSLDVLVTAVQTSGKGTLNSVIKTINAQRVCATSRDIELLSLFYEKKKAFVCIDRPGLSGLRMKATLIAGLKKRKENHFKFIPDQHPWLTEDQSNLFLIEGEHSSVEVCQQNHESIVFKIRENKDDLTYSLIVNTEGKLSLGII